VFGGCAAREACLADAAWPGQRQQAAGRILQQLIDLSQFALASNQRCRRNRQVVSPFLARQFIGADFLEQPSCLFGGFCAQFIRQHAPARFVLRQRRAALPAQRQGTHQLAMRFLTPRIEFQLTDGAMPHSIVFTASIMIIG
jgi:hypothetical protein